MPKKQKKSHCIINDSLLEKVLVHVGINAIVSSLKDAPSWVAAIVDFFQ